MSDITLGQYINGNSSVHRLDPRTKLILCIAFVVMLFTYKSLIQMAVITVYILLIYALIRIPYKMLIRSLKPILPVIFITSFLNMFFVAGEPLISVWKITVTREGLYYAVMLSLRVILLLAGTSLLTYTTTPLQLTNALETLFKPFSKIGLPVHELSMMMTIALRFIPTLLDETQKIMSAQKSRGANLDSGSFMEKIKALIPILIPLFVSAFRRADELALAMECRCYNGGEGRTRLHELKFQLNDLKATLVFFAAMIALYAAGAVL